MHCIMIGPCLQEKLEAFNRGDGDFFIYLLFYEREPVFIIPSMIVVGSMIAFFLFTMYVKFKAVAGERKEK